MDGPEVYDMGCEIMGLSIGVPKDGMGSLKSKPWIIIVTISYSLCICLSMRT